MSREGQIGGPVQHLLYSVKGFMGVGQLSEEIDCRCMVLVLVGQRDSGLS
jgi:hypothetical protein